GGDASVATPRTPPRPSTHDPNDVGRPAYSIRMTSVFEYRPARPVSLADTVLYHRRGPADPSFAVDGTTIWRAVTTPEGSATLAPRQRSDGVVEAQAWGEGANWASAQLPALCGALDDDEGFDATRHPLI